MKKVRIPWARAGAEFIAILAGVTLALLADDWRQYENEREQEQIALREILRDLEADSVALDGLVQLARAQSEAAVWAQGVFGQDLANDSALQGMSALGFVSLYQPVRSGYIGLRDSGRLVLVLNGELRRRIVSYYESTQVYIQQIEELNRPFRQGYFDTVIGDLLVVLEEGVADLSRDAFHQTLRRPWRQVSSEFEFQARITFLGVLVSSFGTRVAEAIDENRQLRIAIAQEIES